MKTLIVYIMVLLSTCTLSVTSVSAQSWLWGKQGYGDAEGYTVTTDAKGNYFLTGYFIDTLSFDTYKLNSFYQTHYYTEAFLVKYDDSGNVRWAIQSYSQSKTGNAYANSTTTDKYGNSFITGFFGDTIKFGAFTIYSQHSNVFITKIDSNGNVVWVKSATGYVETGADSYSVCADNEGNSYITGSFNDTIKFGSFVLISPKLTSSTFLVKFDSSGNVMWAKQSNAYYQSGSEGLSLAIDKMNNILVTGAFDDTISFGPNILTSQKGIYNSFLVKYDSYGSVKWAKQAKGLTVAQSSGGYSVIEDNIANSYITGFFSDTIVFDKDTLNSLNGDIFLAKYDSSGEVVWAKAAKILDNGRWYGYSLAIDTANHLYLAAGRSYHPGNAEIEFGNVTLNLNNVIDAAIVMEFDTSGTTLCGSILPSGGDDNNSIACDPSGQHIYFGGDFEEDTLIFGNDTLSYPYGEYPFVAGWEPCEVVTALKKFIPDNISVGIYPNPTNKIININFNGLPPGLVTLSIMDITGREVLSCEKNVSNGITQVDVSILSPGMYFICIKNEEININQKFIKQ